MARRATVISHRPSSSPYLFRTASVSIPGRKCSGSVPSGKARTSMLPGVRPISSSTSRQRPRVQALTAVSTEASRSAMRAATRLRGERRMRRRRSSSEHRRMPYGMPSRRRTQSAGKPAGLRLPHQTNPGSKARTSRRARCDQTSSPCIVRKRVLRSATRSTGLAKVPSVLSLPETRPVDTSRVPAGYRWASSPVSRAMPPPMGGKS